MNFSRQFKNCKGYIQQPTKKPPKPECSSYRAISLLSNLDESSTHTTEKSFTHLLTTKVEHETVLIKQTALYKKNA